MLKKTITYEDYEGNEVTEDFYFNLTKIEALEMQTEFEGGLSEKIQKIVEEQDTKQIFKMFKDIVLSAYGKRSPDGKRFIKSPEMTEEFEQSPACSELIIGMLQDANAGAKFIEGVLPKKLVEEVKAAEAQNGAGTVELPTAPPVLESSEPTDEELLKMDPRKMTTEQMRRAYMLKMGSEEKS